MRIALLMTVATLVATAGCGGDERKAERAAAALATDNPKRVERAMTYLRDTDDEFVMRQLTHLVKSPDVDSQSRARAVRVLGQRHESLGLIVRVMLDAETSDVRLAGIQAIEDIGDPKMIHHIQAMARSDAEVAKEADAAIESIRTNAVERILKLNDYSESGKAQKEQMTPEQWVHAIRSVAKYIQPSDVEKFERLYEEIPTSPMVRAEIVSALAAMDDEHAQAFVRSRLEAPEDVVRAMALSAVERRADARAVPLLRAMAEKDPNTLLRERAASVVKRIEAKEG